MKYKKHSKKTVIAASVILVTIVCAILGFSALHVIENEHTYADQFPLPQDQKRVKQNELINVLRNYDKKNIADANVYLVDSDGEITKAYIAILCLEKNLNPDMQNGIESLVSEELGLDMQNIFVDYIDPETGNVI